MDIHGSAAEAEAYAQLGKYLFRVAINFLTGKYYSTSYLKRHAGRPVEDLAQDLVQSALINLYENYSSFRWESEVTSYATSILAREILKDQRRASTREIPTSFEPEGNQDEDAYAFLASILSSADTSQEIDLMNREFQELVRQAVDSLSDMQRQALIEYVVEDKDVNIVSEEMGIAPNLVHKLVSRARQKIRAYVNSSDRLAGSRQGAGT